MEAPPPVSPPPPQFVAYPRGAMYGTADKLQALSDGYYGLNAAFVITLFAGILVILLCALSPWALLLLPAISVACGYASFKYVKKIGYGCNWQEKTSTWVTVLLGVSVLITGILGFIALQTIAMQEIRSYGVKGGFFGIRKKHIQEAVAAMRQQEQMAPPPQVPIVTPG